MITASELNIDTLSEGVTAAELAAEIFGPDISVVGASFSGDPDSAGIFDGGDSVAPNATPSDRGIILSTGNVEDFTNSNGPANRAPNTSTNTEDGIDGDPTLNAIAGITTFDAAILDVDFIPNGNVLTLDFVFASEEFLEFQNSIYQDFVAVWINGTEVPISVGNGDIDPGNINSTNNTNLFVDNTGDVVNSEMDGLTVTLSLAVPVNAGEVNSLRLAVADVADAQFDSSLLIAAQSAQTTLVAVDDAATVFPNGSKAVDVLANDISSSGGTLTITEINGFGVTAGSTVILTTGQSVTLNANGTLTIAGDGDVEDFNFTYTVDDGSQSDTGIVNVSSVPCFAAGTRIATPAGHRAVETLSVGDLVLTQDDGPQPVRWIGQRMVRAEGAFAPIHIRENALGQHGALTVSPEHRVLLQDHLAELLFGESEVLVAAKHLVNDHSIRRRPGGFVTYIHVMFDAHQVVFSEGLPSESFLPGPQTSDIFEAGTLDEICAIFPDLDPHTGMGYSPAARRTLRHFEADVWRATTTAA